jgi:MraZ protein
MWGTMFRGSSFHTIDAKGRINIPARFRDKLHHEELEGAIVSRMEGYLVGYPFEAWKQIESKVQNAPQKNGKMRSFRRFFIGGAHPCEADKMGRILIPPSLLEYAELEKDVVLIGVTDHFEIWSREKWDAEHADFEKNMRGDTYDDVINDLGL